VVRIVFRRHYPDAMKEYLDYEDAVRKVQQMVDEVCEKIKNGRLTLGEARKEGALVRLKAEKLIPFEMDKFDLIYMARFSRLIDQFLVPRSRDDKKE
jgi:hypothetical protein